MSKSRAGERGIAPIIALGIFALIALGGALAVISRPASSPEETVSAEISNTPSVLAPTISESHRRATQEIPEKTAPATSKQTSNSVASRDPVNRTAVSAYSSVGRLRSELEMALKSGGISPARSDSMEREINELAAIGADVSVLRALLRELSVGGSGSTQNSSQSSAPKPEQQEERVETRPFWHFDMQKQKHVWAREGEPPPCPEPFILESPVDLSLVSAILYPGQIRGDGAKDFKPHGGFHLKPGNSKVELRSPMDGYITTAAKFTDEFGLHITFSIQHPCGIQFGGGHFGEVPPKIAAALEKVPMKGFMESQTQPVAPPLFIEKGEVIVTGLQEKANTERPGFDWGVMDFRHENEASKSASFIEVYGEKFWNTFYGVCWFDLLPPEQEAIVRSFPGGDGKQGKNSEYCK